MSVRSTLLISLVVLSVGDASAELESGALGSSLTYGYGNAASQSMQALLELSPELEFSFGENTALVASARIRLDAEDELEPGEPTLDTYAPASRPLAISDIGTAELRDFYFELRSRKGVTRLGKQQIVWGRLDGIKVLDLVNPQSFREFIMEDFGNSRVGLWSAYFDYNLANWRTELALVVDGTGHEIPDTGAWFELSAPRFRFGSTTAQPSPPLATDTPRHSFDDAALGLRLSRTFGQVEVSGIAYTGIDPEPLGRITSIDGVPGVERFFERREAYGISAETGLGTVILRAEYAYQPGRYFNQRVGNELSTINLDQHRGAIGLDVNAPFGFFLNIQYLLDSVNNAPTGLVRPETDRVATLYLRRSFMYDALTFEARWYHSFGDDDDLAAVQIEYEFSGGTALRLAVESFSGRGTGLFGQFADRDRIVLGLEHTF